MTTRIAYNNLVHNSGVTVTVDSEQTSFPSGSLLTGLISDLWRSKIGWVIVAGVNDRIDFNRGGVKVATIAPGVYITGELLSAAIDTALTAADGATSWTISYSTTTHKFTIAASASFVLLLGTGSNLVRSIGPDIGFLVADTASATTVTGQRPTYQSRHWVNIDLGAVSGGGIAVVAGVNDAIDFTIDGSSPYFAIVAAGLYSTPDEVCQAVTDALEAAFPVSGRWLCSFDAGTNRYTLGLLDDVDLALKFSTGAHAATDIAQTLGFAATNLSGTYLYEAPNAPAASTAEPITVAIVRGHNLTVGGSARFDTHTASMLTLGLGTYTFSSLLAGKEVRVAFFAAQNKEFVRFVFDDVGNPDGFVEASVLFDSRSIRCSRRSVRCSIPIQSASKEDDESPAGDRRHPLPRNGACDDGGTQWRPVQVQPGKRFPARSADPRRRRQSVQKLRVALTRLPPHDAPHRRVGLQRRRVDRDRLPRSRGRIRRVAPESR